MTQKKGIWVAVGLLALVHLILAVCYNFSTPYLTPGFDISQRSVPIADIGAPDENAHVAYIADLAQGKGWPVLNLGRLKSDPSYRASQYESHQPPLYYAVEALIARISGNPDAQSQSAGHILRLPNALFGALTVLGVFFLVLWGFEKTELALTAALFPALLPMSTALSGAVSNDPLLICLSTWCLAVMVKNCMSGWTWKGLALTVLLAALACWTKTTGLLLLPPILVAWTIRKEARIKPVWAIASVAAFCVVLAPLWIHNVQNYGDPLAMNAFNQAFGDTAQHSTIVKVIEAQGGNPLVGYWGKWVAWWTFRSFIGVFGYMDIWLNSTGTPYSGANDPNWLYLVCLAACAVMFWGWVKAVQTDEGKSRKAVSWILAVHLILITGSFIAFNNHYFQAQGRYLYPAIAAISAGFALGCQAIFKSKWNIIAVVLVLGLGFLQYSSLSILPSAFQVRTTGVQVSTSP